VKFSVLNDPEKLLSPALLQNLLNDRFFKQVPYIPLRRFYESVSVGDMPVFIAFNFYRQPLNDALLFFLQNQYLHTPL
jgi:hypothetical protein